MKSIGIILSMIIFSINLSKASEPEQENIKDTFAISGVITDNQSGEALAGVAVKIGETTVYSDFDGAFKITELKSGSYSIETSYIAYKSEEININLKSDKAFKILLTEE